ncbi:MAG: hypothetical protein IJ213_05170 [Bacteroidales bacterium]|nr:hypothetical protein [Bacteroidales bacterium]
MIISIFKKDYFMQFVLLILVTILLWLPAFINPVAPIINPKLDMPIYNAIVYALTSSSLLSVFIAFLLVVGQAFLLNYVFTNYKLTRKTSYLPAFIYIILMSSDYRVMTMSSLLLANTFIILCLFSFLKCYNKNEGLDEIYLSTLLLSVAALIYAPFILLMIWVWVGLFNFKIYKWRSFFVSLFGFLSPFIILMVYYYLTDKSDLILSFLSDHYTILPDFTFLNQPIQIVYIVYLLIFLGIPAFFKAMTLRTDQKLSVRKRVSTLLLYFAISILPFLYDMNMPTMSLIFAPVLAYMLSLFFSTMKRSLYADTFLIILLVLTVIKIFVNC